MAKCTHHPGRDAVYTFARVPYCQQCRDGMATARRSVDRHVVPKDCFIEYQGRDRWAPLTGTGCAHWIAHELGIKSHGAQVHCLESAIVRVKTLVSRTKSVALADVKLNDIWVSADEGHAGIVIKIVDSEEGGKSTRKITIRHDSSKQGGVYENDFATHFGGKGTFRRL